VLYSRRYINLGIVLITLNERPLNVKSGFFVGRADLKREALIGKKEVKTELSEHPT